MCVGCYNYFFVDVRLKDEIVICFNCRCEINKNFCIRNLVVEKVVLEFSSLC